MLMLFLPVRPGQAQDLHATIGQLISGADPGPDSRPSTGVHFFMTYPMVAGTPSPIIVPTFQAAPGVGGKAKDLLVVLSIYDADFEPYISAFFANPAIVAGLNMIVGMLDETGLVAADDPTSAANIIANGGVRKNPAAFYQLLMRYNFADPTIPAIGPGGIANPAPTPPRYFLGATFPGLTVGKILDLKTGYPDAGALWPESGAPAITYEPSTPPTIS
ncbi:MAG: hypothetical protein ABIS20_09960 [Thermoanaerobaculia bacterium]